MSQDIWQNDRQAEADDLLRAVATELAARKLPVPVTRDLVIYATEVDGGEDELVQLARQLSPSRRASLKRRDLL